MYVCCPFRTGHSRTIILPNYPHSLVNALNTNRFPHTTFTWEGIDGSSVLAHFPPADTYNAQCSVEEILKSESNHKSKLTSRRSLLLFGHGDGGGGPAVSHLERLARLKTLTHPCMVSGENSATSQSRGAQTQPQSQSQPQSVSTQTQELQQQLQLQLPYGVLPVVRTDQTPTEFFEAIETIDYQRPSSLSQLLPIQEPSPLGKRSMGTQSPDEVSKESRFPSRNASGEEVTHTTCSIRNIPPPKWVGELYLELHQGTLTSQAKMKQLNRSCEAALRALEALAVYYTHCGGNHRLDMEDEHSGDRPLRSVASGGATPRGNDDNDNGGSSRIHLQSLRTFIRKKWEALLLNQFHDVLRKLQLCPYFIVPFIT
jgi:Glycosyl hydrolases family 38 N-terminal domain/Alpha mannosidase middle domain